MGRRINYIFTSSSYFKYWALRPSTLRLSSELLTGGSQVDYASATEGSADHFGDRRQLAVTRRVTTWPNVT